MDKIKFLLESTGLTPDELILKLSEYKLITNNNSTSSTENTNECNEDESVSKPEIVEEINDLPESDEETKAADSSCIKYDNEIIEILDDDDDYYCDLNETKVDEQHVSATIAIEHTERADDGVANSPEDHLNQQENNDIKTEKKESPKINPVDEEKPETTEKRAPILGYLRKRTTKGGTRKIIRTSRNPNLELQTSSTSSDESDNVDDSETYKGDNVIAEISKQLLQLRSKKPNIISNSLPILKTYARRNQVSNLETKNDNLFNIKIVDVRGGVRDAENSTSIFIPINDEDELKSEDCDKIKLEEIKTEDNEVEEIEYEENKPKLEDKKDNNYYTLRVINEDLDSQPIRLTKTYDYTNIKGWKRKKFLINAIYEDESYKQFTDINKIYMSEPECSYKILNACKVEIKEAPTEIKIQPEENKVNDVKMAQTLTNDLKDNESTNSAKDISSVFLGSSLDGFLKNEENLNFSLNVPKVLTEVHNTGFKFDSHEVVEYVHTSVEDKPRMTLIKNDDPNRPRTLAEKRKLLEKSKCEPKSKLIKISPEKSLPSDACYSYITWFGKKLKIPTKYKKDVNASRCNKIKPKLFYEQKGMSSRGKPSIYTKPKQRKVGYAAGPLCKKPFMQVAADKNWQTIIKDLPKIKLHVYPSYKTPIHPRVKQFVKFDSWDIDSDRANFAVSATLRNTACDTDKKNKFTFNIPYCHDQSQILVRKKVTISNTENKSITDIKSTRVIESEEDILNEVKIMLSDLIRAVEVKEIESSLIKEDPELFNKNEMPLKQFETDKNLGRKNKRNVFVKGKRGLKHNELKRLNVKIIELNVEEEDDANKECENDFCKYGCVCKSLAGHVPSYDHCGNVSCLFGCVCGYENSKSQVYKLSVPSGINLLSERTVNRLQNVVTKDLAKVEKQFTQTIIHANNQTIVVGDNIDRKRRASRCPNRFKDYVETDFIHDSKNNYDDNVEDVLFKVIDTSNSKRKSSKDNFIDKDCKILLNNLDLKHVYPFCLEHSLYQCHCNFNSLYTKKKIYSEATKKPTIEKSESKKYKQRKRKIDEVDDGEDISRLNSISDLECEVSCARIEPVSSASFIIRNKKPAYKSSLVKRLKLDKTLVREWVHATNESNVINEAITNETKEEKHSCSKSSRRKQKLEVRDDESIALARKKQKETKIAETSVSPEEYSIAPPEAFWEKLTKIIGKKFDGEPPYRLLSWNTLIDLYVKKQLKIWCNNTSLKPKFIISSYDCETVSTYRNVADYESFVSKENIQVDLIRWVVTRQHPECYGDDNKEHVFVIIKKKFGQLFEICGICTKQSSSESDEVSLNSNEEIIDIDKIEENTPNDDKRLDETPRKSIDLKPVEEVVFANNKFSTKFLAPIDFNKGADIRKHDNTISAGIPGTGSYCKWRMLSMASGFDILSFNLNTFCIKYIDLRTVITVALKHKKTIIINPKELSECYKHKLFGIYAVPQYRDRIFIGPYFLSEEHNLKTYHSKDLDNGQEYVLNSYNGLWVSQVDITTNSPVNVIDLTEQEDVKKRKIDTQSLTTENKSLSKSAINVDSNSSSEISLSVKNKGSLQKRFIYNGKLSNGNNSNGSNSNGNNSNGNNSNGITSNLNNSNGNNSNGEHTTQLKPKYLNLEGKIRNKTSPRSILKKRPNLEIITFPASLNVTDERVPTIKPKNSLHPLLLAAMKSVKMEAPNTFPMPIVLKFNFMDLAVFGCLINERAIILWPGEYRFIIKYFININVATDWIKLELSACFIKLPLTFDIEVEVLLDAPCTDAVLEKEHIFNCYIIGEFGMIKAMDMIIFLKNFKEVNEHNIKELITNNYCKKKFLKLFKSFININPISNESTFGYELTRKIITERMENTKRVENIPIKTTKLKILLRCIHLLRELTVSKKHRKKQIVLKNSDNLNKDLKLPKDTDIIAIESDDEEPVKEISVNDNNKTEEPSKDPPTNSNLKPINNVQMVDGKIINVGVSAKVISVHQLKKPIDSISLLSESFHPENNSNKAPLSTVPLLEHADKLVKNVINTIEDTQVPLVSKSVILKLMKNDNGTKSVKIIPSSVNNLKFTSPINKIDNIVINQKVSNDT